ncbi:MAG: DUF502 domain-containing protein [Cyclobacteriaceae bacterium]|nr:DUF502 domain-containing protein [Cytophagales bacterium]MBX2898230.1 DUF502 domain-containing protein [Cyclobacteriaceae bacterium]
MKNHLRRIARYFFSGMVFIVPLLATGYFVFWAFAQLDGLLQLPYPGLGFVIIFAAITLFGYFTSSFAVNTFTDWLDHIISKIPFIKLIYSSVKDLIGAFVGEKRKFDKPVLVTINKENTLHQIGFVTQEDLSELGLKDMVAVYFPHSYAFSGNHFLVSKESIKPLDISGPVAMKFIVSGGISGFKEP